MKKDLDELREINERIKRESDYIKNNPGVNDKNINAIKALKNSIYEKTSKTFIYNLRKLIQIELTQKNFAKKIGISEDLLSKYKSGGAFPSIETLIYISEVYGISIDKLIGTPLSIVELENIENNRTAELNAFEEKYYVYFLATNIAREGVIHEGVVEICNNDVKFDIFSNVEMVKSFTGICNVSDKLIFFNLQSPSDGTAYISMLRPNVNKYRYVGGLAMLMLPSDANSKPCAQKVLFSKVRIDRELHYDNLRKMLNFCIEGTVIGHIKISQWEDEEAYNFIQRVMADVY